MGEEKEEEEKGWGGRRVEREKKRVKEGRRNSKMVMRLPNSMSMSILYPQ